MNREQMEKSIAYMQKDIQDLENKYGNGVTPAWVAEEIGLTSACIQRYQKLLEQENAE